uniref:Wzz/FepE/Etk N-terminal domain-containing protein n=1 Tax=Algoriphagus sp. TaxID=1872435 RepID=UPI0040489BB1
MTDNTPSNSEDEIDLKDLIIPIWKARKQILIIATLCGILGGIIGFLTPATYTASSTFLPQTSQAGGGLSGSLGGLASLAGINLNAPMAGGEIPPTMYEKVLASEPFKKRLLAAKIIVDGDSLAYGTYLENQPNSALGIIKEYTIGLPGKLIEAISGGSDEVGIGENGGLQALSDEEYALHKALADKIRLTADMKEGVVSISVVEGDPFIAAQIAQVTESALQDWIIEHKIKNAKAQYDFIEKQFEAKQKEFFSIQDQLAGYMDRNQNVLSATYLTRLERLQAEFNLVNTVYSELAKQKEQAAIQLSKDTPTFSVLDPVKVPKEKTGPKKRIYVLGAFFIGLILAAGWFLAKNPIQEFFKGIQIES